MTNILLSIILVIMIGRFLLQVSQGTRIEEGSYATAHNVHKVCICAHSADELYERICEQWEYCDYELVTIIREKKMYYAFLQSKKVKTFYE